LTGTGDSRWHTTCSARIYSVADHPAVPVGVRRELIAIGEVHVQEDEQSARLPKVVGPRLEYFKAGKRRTIALIVAGVVAIGGLGAIAALSFGADDERPPAAQVEETSDFDPTPVALPGEPGDDPKPNIRTANPTSDSDVVTIGDGVEILVPDRGRSQPRTRMRPFFSTEEAASSKLLLAPPRVVSMPLDLCRPRLTA
jgi:hypothetical protein